MIYRIYKITIEYSRLGRTGMLVSPNFYEEMIGKSAIYPELIGEYNSRKEALEAWAKAKKDHKYIEYLQNCPCWGGAYLELCTNEEDSICEPSYGDENFYVKDIQIPIYRRQDLRWVR